MTLERDIDLLKSVPFFDGIPPEPMKLIAFSADSREFADKARVFSAGDDAEGGMVVIEGRVDLIDERQTPPKVLERLGPGSLIGELALIVETERPTSAIAVGRARVLWVRRSLFRRMLGEYPEIAVTLRDRISERLSNLSPQIDRVADRLAAIDEG